MKIRTLILTVLAIGMLCSVGILVAFAAREISSIQDVTSAASSDVLKGNAGDNLKNISISIRDSLDNQMNNQYVMVSSWASSPVFIDAALQGADKSLAELYEMWSAAQGRKYDDGEAMGDGRPENDLVPEASLYLSTLSASTSGSVSR